MKKGLSNPTAKQRSRNTGRKSLQEGVLPAGIGVLGPEGGGIALNHACLIEKNKYFVFLRLCGPVGGTPALAVAVKAWGADGPSVACTLP